MSTAMEMSRSAWISVSFTADELKTISEKKMSGGCGCGGCGGGCGGGGDGGGDPVPAGDIPANPSVGEKIAARFR